MAANLSWPVLSLDRIGGYLSFKIVYSQNGGVSKHRTNSVLVVCTTSGCLVPYQQGWVIVQGLNPNIDVNFEITAVNEEAEEGAPIILILSQCKLGYLIYILSTFETMHRPSS